MSILCVTVNLQGSSVERSEGAGDGDLFGKKSYGKYVADPGTGRILAMLDRLGIRATFFVPGYEAEIQPELIRKIAAAGHEIASHGWCHEPCDGSDGEAAQLARAHEVLREVTGVAPTGFRCPTGKMSAATFATLAAMGYHWDSSNQDGDHCYPLDADGGAGMIEVPQAEMLIDATHYSRRATHARFAKWLSEEAGAMIDEDCLVTITLSPRSDDGSGRASRIAAIEPVLQGFLARPGLRTLTAGAAAREFKDQN